MQKDEYFIADPIGLRAIDEEGEAFGTISDVIQTGANDVYVVTTKQGEEVMIPAIKDCILEVSVEEQGWTGRLCQNTSAAGTIGSEQQS